MGRDTSPEYPVPVLPVSRASARGFLCGKINAVLSSFPHCFVDGRGERPNADPRRVVLHCPQAQQQEPKNGMCTPGAIVGMQSAMAGGWSGGTHHAPLTVVRFRA